MTRVAETESGYRRDVDGLRAVAVLAVIVFHFHRESIPGGFLGVDIFFVISGFLITGIIWRAATEGRFSIARFYEQRIRRIVPALALVLFASTLAATLILLPSDLVGFGKSLLATLAFATNIFFWRDTDYFGGSADEKPLLHLWSLGVEEQFYILVPFLLAFLAKRRRSAALPAILVIVGISFGLNVFMLDMGGGPPAFYLLPTRAWELGAGAALALLSHSCRANARIAPFANILGALLIVLNKAAILPLPA